MTNSPAPLDENVLGPRGRRPVGFGRILESIVRAGRGLLARNRPGVRGSDIPAEELGELCQKLLDHRGEASGLALASEILADYETLAPKDRLHFFRVLSTRFDPDPDTVTSAANAYLGAPGLETLAALRKSVEPPRRKLLRRLNMVPGGTAALVRMRGRLLEELDSSGDLNALESDLRQLLIDWFNRGFLVMEQIDWDSSASVLEKIVSYEAVHEINGFENLRTRLDKDRRCFAFFHPAMPRDPLIFVQIALTNGTVGEIAPLLAKDRETLDAEDADTAVFYSITNCHQGLRGISFGNFLIKHVIEELRRDLEGIRHYVTLSPVPGFRRWAMEAALDALPNELHDPINAIRTALSDASDSRSSQLPEDLQARLLRLCAYYLLNEKQNQEPVDPVARFHLGNGASLERINWNADRSAVGFSRSFGIMVNYAYRLHEIEQNHELYFSEGEVVATPEIRKIAQNR